MMPLQGLDFVALGGMAERPLARYLESLGAQRLDSPPAQTAIARAAFLIDDAGLPRLAQQGLTRALLEQWNPKLVHVSVSAFGSTGPRALWSGNELIVSAMGGTLRSIGEPDRPPVKEALDACLFHADMVAAAGAMAAHYSRLQSGRGQHVDISAQEVAFSRNVNGVLVWQFDRRKLHRVGGAINYGTSTLRCIWPLADGWCFHSLMTGRFGAPANQALSDWMDAVGVDNPMRGTDWVRYDRSALPAAQRAEWEAAMACFFSGRTRVEIATEGRRRGINACVVATPADVLADPHLRAREFWQNLAHGRLPGRFTQISPGPAGSPQPEPARRSGRPGPLSGVRVLDFSWALVGSITTKILGDLGAEVIKIESRSRPCLSRLDVQVAASRRGEFDDKPWFAHLNTSKRSLALDLKRPEAREVIFPLLDWADLVVENFSPGTMDKLGLGYQALSQRNPRLVMVSGSVYGQTGPLSAQWGVDGTGAALSGRTYLTGWPDRDPLIPGAVPYGDVIVPYVMAASTVAVLSQRIQSGRGAHIDASMYEICVQQMHAALWAHQQGETLTRCGNGDARRYWQEVLPAAGKDRWVAISVTDEHQWQQLQELCGGRAPEDWSRAQEESALVALLQRLGIEAGMVQDVEDLVEKDEGLKSRGALVTLPHPLLGSFGHVRTPISLSHDSTRPFRAPGIGEHSREVVIGLAGITPERFDELKNAGLFE